MSGVAKGTISSPARFALGPWAIVGLKVTDSGLSKVSKGVVSKLTRNEIGSLPGVVGFSESGRGKSSVGKLTAYELSKLSMENAATEMEKPAMKVGRECMLERQQMRFEQRGGRNN